MSTTKQSSVGGVSFLGMLFIAFLVLKLTGIIEWSWWWVSCPLWAPVAIAMCVIVVIGAYEFLSNK